MIILSNDEVSALLSMDKCLEHLEAAYREQAEGSAVNRPRRSLYVLYRKGWSLLLQNNGGRPHGRKGRCSAHQLGCHQVTEVRSD